MHISEKYKRMSDAAAILRDVYGPNAAKKISRRFGVAIITAKVWLAGRFPETRTQELAIVVREELDRIDARNKEIRRSLGIGVDGLTEASSETGGGAARGDALADRPEVTGMGGAIGR